MGDSNWINQYKHKMQPNLIKELRRPNTANMTSSKKLQVIVQFNKKLSSHHLKSLNKHVEPHHCAVIKKLQLIDSISANVTHTGIKKLCKQTYVSYVYLDHKVHTRLNIAAPAVGAAAAQKSGLTGKGVSIAIIDTGIYPHPDLTKPVNRIIAFKDFVGNRKTPYDDNGHGTHVSGDASGNGFSSKGKYKGTAPKASLVGVKVLDRNGSGDISKVIEGIQWVIHNRRRYNIRIINLSLGAAGVKKCSQDPLCQAVTKAWKSGIVVVAAAGNSGPSSGTIESPGINPFIITVGAVNDRRTIRQSDDIMAGFSSRGPVSGSHKPDIVAPGSNIVSLRAPNSQLSRGLRSQIVGGSYLRLSGTSMATPIVAGAIAQILQRFPGMRPGQLKAMLKRKAVNLGFKSTAQGSGEVNNRFLK